MRKGGKIAHLTNRAEATETIHIIQPHFTSSFYHSTSNSSANLQNANKQQNKSKSNKVHNFPQSANTPDHSHKQLVFFFLKEKRGIYNTQIINK